MKNIVFLLFLIPMISFSQENFFNKNLKSFQGFKLSGSFFMQKGRGSMIGIGYGYGIRGQRLQSGLNYSMNIRFGQNNLGNRALHRTTKWQLNTILSPIFTLNLANKNALGRTEVLEAGYFGVTSGLYNSYLSSVSFGSSFVVMPRGLGRNIQTARNRSQQLVYAQLNHGWVSKKYGVQSLQINLYEDFLFTDNRLLQGFADNFDRFFTGGGNLKFRLSDQLQLKLYTEVYTGANDRDDFDFPDWVDTVNVNNQNNKWGNKKLIRKARYAYQEPSQQLYNQGRSMFIAEYTLPNSYTNLFENSTSTVEVIINFQSVNSMRSQNAVHSRVNKLDKPIGSVFKSDSLFRPKAIGDKTMDRLHFFYPNKATVNKNVFDYIGLGIYQKSF